MSWYSGDLWCRWSLGLHGTADLVKTEDDAGLAKTHRPAGLRETHSAVDEWKPILMEA